MAPSISLELRPQIENVHQFLRNGETDLSIMPADFIDPEQPHEQLFEDTFSCVTTHDFTSLIPMVVNTQMIAITQTRLALDTQARLPIRVLAPPVPLPALRMSMQWHRYQTNDPSHRWLREQLVEVARQLDLPGQSVPQ